MAEVEIYSATVCPYAHRTRLALLEKGVDCTLTEIDLENKPDWFTDISPYGKVPLLKHGDDCIWESTIINEYLDEVFPNTPLMPTEPGQRAIARIWIDLSFYPWFERWPVLEHYRTFTLPSECSRLKQWQSAMGVRASVQAIKNTQDFYIQQYIKYANGTASGITAQEMRRVR